MGVFTQVTRFFQRIESPTVTRQFQLVVQDYGKDKNLEAEIRKAVAEAAKVSGRRDEGGRRSRDSRPSP